MTQRMGNFSRLLLTTIASGLVLTACSGGSMFSKEEEPIAPRRPVNNPSGPLGGDARAPAMNMTADVGAQYRAQENQSSNNMAMADAAPQAGMPEWVDQSRLPKEEKGFFSFLYRDDAASVEGAPLPAGGPSMAAAPRKAPEGNRQPAIAPMASAAPVEDVEMGNLPEDYPALSDVPPVPERLDSGKGAGMMAEMKQDKMTMEAGRKELAMQQAADGSMMAESDVPAGDVVVGDRDVGAEFAALVSPQSDMKSNMASEASETPAWEPAPLIAPDTEMASASAPAEGEWIDISGGATQQAVPVEQVSVASAPQPVSVPAAPIAPSWNGGASAGGGIALRPPQTVRVSTLPQSRYAARREAVHMHRYQMMERARRHGY